jgi:predicted RNase H-like nuclease (RuvC/YqgF family)
MTEERAKNERLVSLGIEDLRFENDQLKAEIKERDEHIERLANSLGEMEVWGQSNLDWAKRLRAEVEQLRKVAEAARKVAGIIRVDFGSFPELDAALASLPHKEGEE